MKAHIQVTTDATAYRLALIGQPDHLAVINPGWNHYFDRLTFLDHSDTIASMTNFLRYFATPITLRTLTRRAEGAKEGLPCLMNLSFAITSRASLGLATRFGPFAGAHITNANFIDQHFARDTKNGIGKTNLNIHGDIASSLRSATPAAALSSAKKLTENVPKVELEALSIAILKSAKIKTSLICTTKARSRSGTTKSVVLLTLPVIKESLIGLVDLLELGFVATLFVRMILVRQFMERLLNLLFRGAFVDT